VIDCPLSVRQHEVMLLIMRGLTYKQAARELGITHSTARTHMHRGYVRLGVSDKGRACALMLRNCWVDPGELLADYAGPPYTTAKHHAREANWLPSPAQRLYLDAFDKTLTERNELRHARAGAIRGALWFERDQPAPPRKAHDFDGMVTKIAPSICTHEQHAVLEGPRGQLVA
jgi:DNA-binding CsgD family transcriptional regulator